MTCRKTGEREHEILELGALAASLLVTPLGATTMTAPAEPTKTGGDALPFSGGRPFAELDRYLVFRKARGAMDLPYYEEVAPDVFQLMAGRGHGGDAPKLFTRAELLAEFCFER